jgi:glycosyltransferase involved in cell wall biosynthesis
MADPGSRIAVVVPAHDAQDTIAATLAALAAQDLGRPFEVIVADDRSADATAALAAEHGARVVELTEQGGPGAARNAGVAATDAEVIAFTDADCEPAPGWLREGVAAIEAGADLVTGPIEPVRPPGPWDRTLNVRGPSVLFESANVFAARSLFDRLGGFHRPARLDIAVEDGHFGEDVVFGWRAVREGARVEFAPGAVVKHAVFARDARGYIAERWRLRLFPMLLGEVPELRDSRPLRLFLSPRTARFDLALAGVAAAVARRSPVPLLAAIPYVRRDLRTSQPWRRSVARANAAYAIGDLVGFAALVYGSAVHRRVLL